MDLTLLTTAPDGIANAGLDAVDPRFVELATLVENGEYAAAAAAAETLLAEGVRDVRVIGYHAYGLFLEGGVAALGPVAAALADLYRSHLTALGPEANKLKHLQTSVGWLVKQVTRKLQREEATKGDAWARLAETSVEELDAARAGLDALRGALLVVLGDRAGALVAGLGKLDQLVEGLEAVARREPEPPPEPAREQPAPGAQPPEPAQPVPAAQGAAAPAAAEGSAALRDLLRKLAAFEELLAAGKLPQARIVADDLQYTLAHFDPRVFFPGLFAPFLRLLVTRADELAATEEQRDSPRWKALAEYYRVDLEGFTRL